MNSGRSASWVSARNNIAAIHNEDRDSRLLKAVRNLHMKNLTAKTASLAPRFTHGTMKLIPWEDIWTSLRVAKIRGNGDMIDVFYDTLFKEAIFDDQGAWSVRVSK